MKCPKCKKDFFDGTLEKDLAVKCCGECKGTWIRADDYEAWQERQPQLTPSPLNDLTRSLNVDFVQSPFDIKAALCPECTHYLSRAKVNLKTPFYVERCANCGGIWCDNGEWDILQRLGMHTTIEQLFSSEWQTRMQHKQQAEKERDATIEKLGPELAARLFELAQDLEKHPNGDFGVAYLMRRISQ